MGKNKTQKIHLYSIYLVTQYWEHCVYLHNHTQSHSNTSGMLKQNQTHTNRSSNQGASNFRPSEKALNMQSDEAAATTNQSTQKAVLKITGLHDTFPSCSIAGEVIPGEAGSAHILTYVYDHREMHRGGWEANGQYLSKSASRTIWSWDTVTVTHASECVIGGVGLETEKKEWEVTTMSQTENS